MIRMTRRLSVVLLILATAGCLPKITPKKSVGNQYIAAQNAPVEFLFPEGWYKQTKENPYDLQCLSKDDRMVTGVFVFLKEDLAEDLSPHKLLEMQIDDLKSKRSNFKLFEAEQKVQQDNKSLTSIVYSGEKDSSRFYYRFTLIEFTAKADFPTVVIQVAMPSSWAEQKPVLEAITNSARIKPS